MISFDFSLGFRRIYSRYGLIRDKTELRYVIDWRAFKGHVGGEERHLCADSKYYHTLVYEIHGSIAYSRSQCRRWLDKSAWFLEKC